MRYKKYVLTVLACLSFYNCTAMKKNGHKNRRQNDCLMVRLETKDVEKLMQDYIDGKRSTCKKEELDEKTKKRFWTFFERSIDPSSYKKGPVGKPPLGRSRVQVLSKKYIDVWKKEYVKLSVQKNITLTIKRLIKVFEGESLPIKQENKAVTKLEFQNNLLPIIRTFGRVYLKEDKKDENNPKDIKNPEEICDKNKIHMMLAKLISMMLYKINNNLPEIEEDEEKEEEDEEKEEEGEEEEKQIISYEQIVLLEKIENILLLYGYTHPSSEHDLFFFLYAHTYNRLLVLLYSNGIMVGEDLMKIYPNMYNNNGKNMYRKYYDNQFGDLRLFNGATRKLFQNDEEEN